MKVKLLHPQAQMPDYATEGAIAFDLRTVEAGEVMPWSGTTFSTGIAVEVPQGYGLFAFSRSGHGFNHGLRLGNGTGLIDTDYRGEIKVRVHNDSRIPFSFEAGDRIAQAVLLPVIRVNFEQVEHLTSTERGEGGFGSTGVK
jgi:dUTP pyrophosphatase